MGERARKLLSKPGEGRSRVTEKNHFALSRSSSRFFSISFFLNLPPAPLHLTFDRGSFPLSFSKMGRKKIVIERITDERNRQVRRRKKRAKKKAKVFSFSSTLTKTPDLDSRQKTKIETKKNRSRSPSARTA